ncbi:hypothetical protein BH11PLA2_BH11PLA2_38340 [soil metagenome]
MKITTGDLLALAKEGVFDVIVHGCNCQCAMGRGIALTIKNQFPQAYAADLATTKGDRFKLGSFTSAAVTRADGSFTIVNAYTQFDYKGEGVLVDYGALRSAFRQVKKQFTRQRIGYPKIGAGLARGDWSQIASIIDEELAGEDHTLVEFG